MATNKNYKSYTIVAVFLIIYAVLIVSLIVWLFSTGGDKNVINKLQSPPVIILAIVISVLTFTVSSAVFSAIDKGRSTTALGMPDGSIRALIALSLITLFFILATQIYSKVSEGGIGKIERVSEESLKEISIKDIISKEKVDSLLNKDTTNPGTTSKYLYFYNVTVRVAANSDASDMAKNIIASFTALIAAICGFYFGSGASKQSADTLKEIMNPPPTPPKKITSKSLIPANSKIGDKLTFEWDVTPPGELIKVEAKTPDNIQPVADTSNRLKYTYTPTIAGKVTIKVSLISDPAIFLEHQIEIS